MRSATRVLLLAGVGAGAAVVPLAIGCMGEGTTCPPPPPVSDASGDGAKDGGGDGEAGPAIAGIRLANLSPNSPQIDFCIAPFGTTAFHGPLLAALAGQLAEAGTPSDAGAGGLGFAQVSAYVPVAAFQQYSVRIVVGGSSDCAGPIVPQDLSSLPVLAGGGAATVAFLGEAQPPSMLQSIGLADDPTQSIPDGGSAKVYLRFLHAAPGQPPVDVGLDIGKGPKTLFSSVAFGKTSTGPGNPDAGIKIDNNGYLSTGVLSRASCGSVHNCPLLSVVPSGSEAGAPIATGDIFSAAAGSILTVALVGDTVVTTPDSGAVGTPLELLECVDNAATVTPLGSCTVLTVTQM